MKQVQLAGYEATHFRYAARGKVATITLNRPDKKNPLTFDSYAELGALFRNLAHASDVKAVVVTGEGGNFCSGGDVHEIIGPLVAMDMPGLLRFAQPSEVADAVAFFAGAQSNYVTGQVLSVSGGLTMVG